MISRSNLVIVFVDCWICLTAAIGCRGQVTCFDGGDENDIGTYVKLDNELKEIMRGSPWQAAASSTRDFREVDATTATKAVRTKSAATKTTPSKAAPATTIWTDATQTKRFKLLDGLFSSNVQREAARKKSPSKACRVKDTATREKSNRTDAGGVAHNGTVTETTAATSGPPNRTVFDDEDECMMANAGRSCVCYLTDLLDLIDQRLDDPTFAADEDATTSPAFKCPSYKPVPTAFVVSSRAATPSHDETTTVQVTLNDSYSDGGRPVTSPAWREVDFDSVVGYKLKTFKDGR